MVSLVKGAKTSADAAVNAIRYEEKLAVVAEETQRRLSPKGHFKQNSQLLEDRRHEYIIPDGYFKFQMVFDRILVCQQGKSNPGEGGNTFGDTSIIMPEVSAAKDTAEAPRGIIVNAGLDALDSLRANGIDLGHMVTFIRNAPWRMIVDNVNGHDFEALIFRAGDVTGSEDLSDALISGQAKIECKETEAADGVVQREHFFVDAEGRSWNPQLPFIGDDF